ncbi:putative leucine aminopeptidase 1 [Smittium culicis]|uniref:Peptide hydrolase n=1 Tax=Smittium culicis TaxID=133412 RepID=A0A1R1Y756_9FUNG|nr:putative leucine aminopeptidase 1 [Smittium culicis]OMJ22792.1 putative leucine aminopeptidase 1 [Smittium culicis]
MKLSTYACLLLSSTVIATAPHNENEASFGYTGLLSYFNKIKSFLYNESVSALGDAFYSNKRLIKLSDSAPPKLLSENEIKKIRMKGYSFMDVTDNESLEKVGTYKNLEIDYPQVVSHHETVSKLNAGLSPEFTFNTLSKFTSFNTRYFNSDSGRDAALWLKDRIQDVIDAGNANKYVSVKTFEHKFKQPSLIARIEGSGSNSSQILIVTAHLDSVNQWIPWFGRAPGADDNGSGTVTILDAFRVLLDSGFKPQRTVEFHWYAGEEGGLLGSQDVANFYKKNEINMIGQLHFDMTGFKNGQTTFGLVNDNVNNELKAFIRLLATEYSNLTPKELSCGYACSDHASWNKAGYRSVMGFESDNLSAYTHIHSPSDTVDKLDFNHMLEFSKVAVAYCIEIGL